MFYNIQYFVRYTIIENLKYCRISNVALYTLDLNITER